MRAVTKLGLSLALCVAGTGMALAQTETTQQTTQTTQATQATQAGQPDAAAKPEAALESVNVVVTNKEVSAVQAALLSRGYLSARPNGVMNAETRTALRGWQGDNNLPVTGRIDRATLASLEVNYPATGKEADSARRNGMFSKVGYAVKDGAVASKNVVTGATHKTINGVKTGYTVSKNKTVGAARFTRDKTVGAARFSKDKTVGAFSRSRNVTVGVGESTASGVKTAGRKTGGALQRTSSAVVGRSDLDIQTDVREALNADPETRKFTTTVRSGNVTVKLPPGYQGEYGGAIASIRRVDGVKSVFVVQP